MSRGWYFPHDCPAQVIALVALDVDTVWLLSLEEAKQHAQQHSAKGIRQIYWRIDAPAAGSALKHEKQMSPYLLEVQASALFP